jgi:hypothetical protein
MPPALKRFCLALIAAFVLGAFALPAATASADPVPWWQVLTGSRPTNLWKPTDNVQEIKTEFGFFSGFNGLAGKIEVKGKTIGCLGSADFVAAFLCGSVGFSPEQTAAQLEATLEAAFGTSAVEVAGGPVGGEPFVVTTPDQPEPSITVNTGFKLGPNEIHYGSSRTKVISSGGSGRLVATVTNLGDAPITTPSNPVIIVDHLPEGVEAKLAEGFISLGSTGTVNCEVKAPDEVVCAFEGELPPFEALEIEIAANLTGEPPVQGKPGEVTVSGGNAPTKSSPQEIKFSPEPAPFGFEHFSAESEEEGGTPTSHAGSHPFQLTTTIQLNSGPLIGERPHARVEEPALPRNLRFPLPVGLVGNATAMERCPMTTFLEPHGLENRCPDASAIGVASVTTVESGHLGLARFAVPVFNLPPANGEPARFGLMPAGVPVVIDTEVDPDNQYKIIAKVDHITQIAQFLSSTVAFWGIPGDPRHDNARGWGCAFLEHPYPCERPAQLSEVAFLRQPVSCTGPLDFHAEIEPWNVQLGTVVDKAEWTQPSMLACNQVRLNPAISAEPTSKFAESSSGIGFKLTLPDQWPSGEKSIAEGQPKKVEVTLPEGMTVNPSQGEGLAGCSPADYARERASSLPGEGCPEASKIGTVQIATPLLEEEAHGALYVATPFDNPSGSLLALYMVAKIPQRGIVVKQAGVVKPDPVTGRLTTTFDDLPQLPFSSFDLHFKEGGRAPLITPPTCGKYDVVARFTPWSAQDPDNPTPDEIVTRTSSFEVERGVDGGACPSAGTLPFHPELLAGTINNAAGRYSPFNLRLTRKDGEQEFKDFSIKLPPGVVGKLAGIPFCSDAAIAAAKARSGSVGGQEELGHPSCSSASQIGHTLVGAGVGAYLTSVSGKVYLAGPYHGSPLSVVAITPVKVGPFDLGTVVIREALRINPETAEVFIDATGSDPIPHIIQGIPVHARDIRVYVDRGEFVLNPTSCERTSTASTVLGSGLDFGSSADDVPVTVTSPFQAADCANLGFKPKLQLQLRGKTTRGGNPALRAVLRPRKGDANAARISVALPHSEFLDQGHIRTVCTRVQFKAGAGNGANCPKGSVYGHATVWTPLFDRPLKGPVFLRSSEHPLPDLVLALHGLVDIDAVGRIDSVGGGIRNTFDFVPDAPVTKVVLSMQGGKKGLLENSTDICRGKHRATVKMKGHNGRIHNFLAPLKARCPSKHARRHR